MIENKPKRCHKRKNDSITYIQCRNDLVVFYGVVNTGKNFGVVGIGATVSVGSRKIIVSTVEVAKAIADLLIKDFGGDKNKST